MELSNEDFLRLNVLLANQVQAIRIDETNMIVYALCERGEAKVQLHPNCRDEHYLRQVRDWFSSQILGIPKGYPGFLKHWNRMGQLKDASLEQLLKLGEAEALVAVVNAPGLTPELARRAWWVRADSDNARSMLKRETIVQSEIGKVLANYLVEYLPFEEEAIHIIDSVRLVLQDHLINAATKQHLWQRKRTKDAYLVGFLWAHPDNLPDLLPERYDAPAIQARLRPFQHHPLAGQLVRITSRAGQTFLNTCEQVLRQPSNQEVVNAVFEILAKYFESIRPLTYGDDLNIMTLLTQATSDKTSVEQREILAVMPELQETITAMLVLSGLGYSVLRPVFSRTTATGSLMRKKLAPIIEPLLAQLAILQQGAKHDSLD